MGGNNLNLFNGDSKILFSTIKDGSIDLVVTDPPYGMDFQSNWSKSGPRYNKIIGDSGVDGWWLKESYRCLKNGGGLIFFCNWKNSFEWYYKAINAGFTIKSQVIWDREHHGMGDLKGGFAPQHDVIWYATKGRRIFVNGRPKSVQRFKRPGPSQDFGHPTCKPVLLMESLVKSVQDGSRGTVLDPFMGSGSTGVACKKLGVTFIGFEMDKVYFDNAVHRLEGDSCI